jgi:hypothetical protein
MSKVAVGMAVGAIAMLGVTGIAASMSQTGATPTPSPNVSASARVTSVPTPVVKATPNYVAPTAIPTTPVPLARTDASAPMVVVPAAPVAVSIPQSASAPVVHSVAPVAPAAHVVAPAAPAAPVIPVTKIIIPTLPTAPLGSGSGVDCAHLKPGDAFAGISQVCHLDPSDPLHVCTDPRPGMCNMAGGPGLVIPPKTVATPPVCGTLPKK